MNHIDVVITALTLAACGGLAACRGTSEPAPSASAVAAPASASVAVPAWIPVATYLFSDRETGERLVVALESEGIASVTAGSLGGTMSVAAADAPRARAILGDLVERDRLEASIVAPP